MLKEIYGMPDIFVFEARNKATDIETDLKNKFGQRHCFRGLLGADRNEMSQNIVEKFMTTSHFVSLSETEKTEFKRFLVSIYFAKRHHPKNPKRTFFWGDCLEPGFLRTIGVPELEPVIERVLRVKF